MRSIWRVEMLGTLEAKAEDSSISRFRTRRVGLLLAYLAYYRERNHSRDELADMLWPDSEPELARRNLRQALSSLRRHLEPPSVPTGAILISKQALVSLSSVHVCTDVEEFEQSLKDAATAVSNAEKIERLKRAVELYKGDLLPGYYEDWVQRERLHLEDLFVSALQSLVHACEAEEQTDEAISYIRLALAKDYLQEDLHATLMRLYLASERPASALQHFEDWKEKLASELSDEPSREMKELAERAKRGTRSFPGKAARIANQAGAKVVQDLPVSVTRLPVQVTRFFGRRSDLARAMDDITCRRTRLLTLWGPAGTGKTRLSVEVGRRLAEECGWNVWFVPLADLSDGAMLVDAIFEAMRVRREGDNPIEALQAHLTGDRNLLILDNMEHILEEAAPLVEQIHREVPSASILVTSRQALKLGGEHEIDLASLPLPSTDLESLQELAEVPSVQLFVDRAQAIHPDFQVTQHNAQTISSICTRLDGLPLALEIAAGLSNAFTPSQLLQNLENRLEVLRSRRRDLSPRHQSLRAAIDYSYDLLSPDLQRLFVSLSVFRGGFTVEAAGTICMSEAKKQGEYLRMLLDLQERSLLRSQDTSEGCPARFQLLESFREYGLEQLNSEENSALRRRHAMYFYDLVKGESSVNPLEERENRLAALQFFFEERCVHECVVLLASLQSHSYIGRETIVALARLPDFNEFEPFDQIRILGMLGKVHRYASEYEENYRVDLRALDIAVRFGNEGYIAMVHQQVALSLAYLGRLEEAIFHSEQNLAYGEKAGDLLAVEIANTNIGTNRWAMGDFDGALHAFEKARLASAELHRGDPNWLILYNLGRVNLDAGNLDDGLQFAGESLRIAQSREDEFGISMCLSLISRYHKLKGNLVAALATSHEALVKRKKVGFIYWTLNAILGHASVLIDMGRFKQAATLLAASRAVTKMNRAVDNKEYASALEAVRTNLSESSFEQAWAEGLAMNMEEAFQLAIRQI